MPRNSVTCQASALPHSRSPCGACAVTDAGRVRRDNCGSHSNAPSAGTASRHSAEKRHVASDSAASGIATAEAAPAITLMVST